MKRFKKSICRILTLAMLISALTCGTVFADEQEGVWKRNKTGWWYEYEDGTYAQSTWIQYEKKWYYMLDTGYMETNGYREGYWISKSGVMSTKYKGGRWKKDSTGWWYTDRTGWYPKNQWLKIDGLWYYFNAKGYMEENEWIDGYCLGADGAWDKNASKAWAASYLDYIKTTYEGTTDTPTSFEYLSFDLIYVDNDSTPELLIRSIENGLENIIVSYYDGKLLELPGLGDDGNLYYIDHSGLILSSGGRQGVYSDEVIELKDGKNTTLHEGFVLERTDESDDYSWDDMHYITPNQYEEYRKAAFDTSKALDVEYNSYYSYEDMMNLLGSYGK